jgi:WD40 repeat protein/DNA-binding SARP family transcriptional activator/class 3 adenylate cyclase/tRNA A-37 threonylcarbamoyl transferase component Bud32
MHAPRRRELTGPLEPARTTASKGTADEIRTFLIADVRGYTLFTQERGDEAAARLTARFAGFVREQIEARDGSVIELRGDEALAVFRSPRQAIRAAVELQARLLEETTATPDLPLPVGIGLDAGEAVPVEGGYRGGALNLAARLCSEAGPGEILASRSVVHLARTVDGVRYLDRGELHLKGLADPVHVLAIASEGIDVVGQMRSLVPRRPARRVYKGTTQFRVLGPLEVDAGSGPIPLGGPKQRAVLALLLIRANELVPAETLVDEVWGEDPPETARNTIQTYISHLRKAVGHDHIQSNGRGYRLRLDPSELDAARFDALVRDAKKVLPVDPNIAVGTFDDALALWRGPALADLADQPSLVAEAARLDDLRLEAQEDRIEGLLANGAQARAIGELEILIARHPWRERLWGLLMLALYREGRQAEALGAYQRAKEMLADELGIDPAPELMRLHERVLKQDPGLDLRGEPLRGYRLLEKIDDGPTGVVFRAIQPHVERDVAVKIFHESIATDTAFVRRFESEAQAVAALEHPHIAPIYDYWREPGRAYIVSRYLRGGSLRGLEDRGESLDPDRALRVVEQIALALAFAHRQGLAHGSVRSSNVLFDGEGNAYVGDFLVGAGRSPDPAEDVRELARLARGLLANDMPQRFAELTERAEVGADGLQADALAEAARTALEPSAVAGPRRLDERNPYKGLRAFTEADARDFFGRGELTQRLVTRLGEGGPESRFLALVGPSGGGKSSVVRAGLVPAIRRGALGDSQEPFIAEMFPGANPLEELEAALLRIAARPASRLHDLLDSGSRGLLHAVDLVAPGGAEVVLVVDQFEEVFTLTTDERGRELFLEALRVAVADPESRLRVIVTLRADFYDRPLIYPRFGDLLAARTEAVPPLTPDELEKAIRGPAEHVGVRPEPGLVAEMIADVAHQPGALPLLQYAVTELFERRDDDRMTLTAYQEIGGIAGALSARADRIYEANDPHGRRVIKQVFLRLVTLGEGRPDTRRRVARSELDALDVDTEAINAVVDSFGRHRLLTFDREPSTREPTVEIAHEALFAAWGRLRTWIDDAREDLRLDQGLARAEAEWRGSRRETSFLLRGVRLEQLETWAEATDLAIGRPEREYLKASVDERERERDEAQERREREARLERRSRTRLRALVAVFAIAALVAGSLTVVATNQSERAGREARIATARELAAAAVANVEADPEHSVLLAMQAVELTRSVDGYVLPQAEDALHRAVVASRLVRSVPGVGGLLDWSPTGVFVTEGVEDSGIIDIRDGETGQSVLSFEGHDGDVNDVAFSPDGSMLASTGDDGKVKVWDPSTGRLLASASGRGGAFGPSFSADGSLVAAAWYAGLRGWVRVLDVSTGRVVWTRSFEGAIDTALSPDGKRLAVASFWRDGAVFDLETREGGFVELNGTVGSILVLHGGVSWSPDGRYIAATTGDGTGVWDAATGRRRFTLLGQTGYVLSVAWSTDSSRVVTGGSDGTARVWEIEAGGVRELWSLSARETRSGIVGVAFSPDGARLMAGDAGISAVKIWDLGPSGDAEWASLPAAGAPAEFMPDGRRLVATSGAVNSVLTSDVVIGESSVRIWDLQTGRVIQTIVPPTDDFWFDASDVSPDGEAIALGGGRPSGFGGEAARAWDTATGEELYRIWHDYDVNDLSFSPDGELLVTASWDGSAKIVDSSGHVIRVLQDEATDVVTSARFSPDGRLVATAASLGLTESGTGHVRIWDWEGGELVRTISTDAFSVDFDPSGSRIATASLHGQAQIWDVESGARVAVLAGNSGGIYDVAFSPDGSRVATAGLDGTIRLFEAGTGAQQLVLRGHRCGVQSVAFSPDGTQLASASACDGTRIWALDIDDLLEIARQQVASSLTDEECRRQLHLEACPTA